MRSVRSGLGTLWFLAVAVDVAGGLVGFYTPGLGRSRTADWTIEGNHLAERCQAFLLIALGESVVVIGGIIVTAAADQKVLAHPLATPDLATAAMILGGCALFVAGHAAFKAVVWRVVQTTRLAAVVVLGLLGFLAPDVSAVVLGICAGAVLIALAASDRHRSGDPDESDGGEGSGAAGSASGTPCASRWRSPRMVSSRGSPSFDACRSPRRG